jgi:hypothetical protein
MQPVLVWSFAAAVLNFFNFLNEFKVKGRLPQKSLYFSNSSVDGSCMEVFLPIGWKLYLMKNSTNCCPTLLF